MTDASKRSISFILWQESDEEIDYVNTNTLQGLQNPHEIHLRKRKKHFISCYSRKLTRSESAYSIFKLEILAALSGLEHGR